MKDRILTGAVINYPPLTLWRTKIAPEERLRIINPGDFQKQLYLEGLGIDRSRFADSFGICDAEEIKERLNLIRFLVDNPEATDALNKMASCSDLPSYEKSFIDYFDPKKPHNPHWENVHKFLDLMAQKTLPLRLRKIADALQNSLGLEKNEKEMAEVISDRLTNIAVIEGLAEFTMHLEQEQVQKSSDPAAEDQGAKLKTIVTDLHPGANETHGHRMYSFALAEARRHSYPEWTERKWHPLNWIGIGKLARKRVDKKNKREKEKAYRDMVITEASAGLIEDIMKGALQRLNELDWDSIEKRKEFEGATVHVYFSYSNQGLMLHIYAIDPYVSQPREYFGFAVYEGYDSKRREIIYEAQARFVKKIKQDRQDMVSNTIREVIRKQQPDFFDSKFSTRSPETDKEHRWFALSNLYESQMLNEVYKSCLQHRLFFYEHVSVLKEVIFLAETLKKKSSELNTNLVFPKILDDGGCVIRFDEILPFHLLTRKKPGELIPIRSLPMLNGNMVGLTGFNGGGKTVTEEALVGNVFLIQSGLPVLGKGDFTLNIKKVFGMVFIERGEGSTCQLLLQKIKNVLEGIKDYEGGEVVLILDEVGTGTQELSGLSLGKDLLTKLSKTRVSTIFSTQITQLAEYAQSKLGAKCFQVDQKHCISPGIGTGGMDQLRKEMGLDKLLEI